MKTIIFLRHAKAAAGDSRMRDEDRPLNEQGISACDQMGAWMKAHLGPPDRVLCSSSKRTRQTAEWVLPKAGFQTPVQYEDGLYLATAGEILTHAQRLDDRVRSVLIIGHNPGMHEVALRLYAKGDPALIELLEIKFPTACLAAFTVPVEHWRELAPHTGTLTHFISPKMLNSEISE